MVLNKHEHNQNQNLKFDVILKRLNVPEYLKLYVMKQLENEHIQQKLIQKLYRNNRKLNKMNRELLSKLSYESVKPLSIANVMPYLQQMRKKHREYITIKGLRKYFHINTVQAERTVDNLVKLGIASFGR